MSARLYLIKPLISIQHALYHLKKEYFDGTVLDLYILGEIYWSNGTFEKSGVSSVFQESLSKYVKCVSFLSVEVACLPNSLTFVHKVVWVTFADPPSF